MGMAAAALWGMLLVQADREPQPVIAPKQFQKWFDEARSGKLELPEAVRERAARFRYVFVGGFQNELKPGYFVQNIKELRAQGVPRKQIDEIYPSSRKTIDENRDTMRRGFRKVAENGPEKLVIIAHSRGACDALAFAVENPELIARRVEAIFLVQGPFGGTPLADYVVGEGKKIDGKLPRRDRMVGRATSRMERFLWKRGNHAGLSGLTQSASQEFWDELLDENAEALEVVDARTYYITSQIDPAELGFVQGSMGRYLDTYYGANDGIVPLAAQHLPGLGTNLGAFAVGHSDLTQKFPAAHGSRRLRKALVQAILMAVGQEANENSDGGRE